MNRNQIEKKESQTLESSKSKDKKRETQDRKKMSETLEVRENFLATKGEVKGLFHSKQLLYLLICKNYVLTTNTFDNFELKNSYPFLPPSCMASLQVVPVVFPVP